MFEVRTNSQSAYSFAFNRVVSWSSLQLPVFELKHDQNVVVFNGIKCGSRTEPDPDENGGGKGWVHISQVSLTYHRDVNV
jgi:hypothetical protein